MISFKIPYHPAEEKEGFHVACMFVLLGEITKSDNQNKGANIGGLGLVMRKGEKGSLSDVPRETPWLELEVVGFIDKFASCFTWNIGDRLNKPVLQICKKSLFIIVILQSKGIFLDFRFPLLSS